jgi:hypothetical protein
VDLLGWLLFIGAERVGLKEAEAALDRRPDTVLLAACSSFDAISVPYEAAADALLRLDREETTSAAPCLFYGDTGTFLVEVSTGKQVAELEGVQVATGPDALIVVPPTSGARWDTPPWSRTERMSLALPSASDIRAALADGLHLYPRVTGVKS